ncbi:MAG: RNA-binding domain-containing protein [Candidatus Bathyarchaeia archaeon]
MDEVTVSVEADVNLTESEEKVKKAVDNLFGNLTIEIQPSHKGSLLKAEAKGQEALIKFRDLLRQDRIRDAARKALFEVMHGQTISFYLNKQAAFAGHVSFSEAEAESPLGPIKVTIKCDDPRRLIDWLAPRTA